MSPDVSVPSTETLVDKVPRHLSSTRKSVLLLILCLGQFLDAFNNAALFSAIPALEASLGITQGQSAWVLSAFQLTFASFLLISGRISDLYNPKMVFVAGLFSLGVISLCAGFANNKVVVIILRALMGIASAMTIPSALALLVRIFPEPLEQARAIGILGGCGASADILGFFIGAILVQYASYRWVFWFSAIVTISLSQASFFIIPQEVGKSENAPEIRNVKWKNLDIVGISILTVALILFIYSVTSGSTVGWATSGILTPLFSSILLIAGFFYWETLIPFEEAAIPPNTWFFRNFSVLFGMALLPFLWWNAIFLAFMTLWKDIFRWTVISAAIHMLPVGLAAFLMSFTGGLSGFFSPKWIIITGLSMTATSTVLLAVGGDRLEGYWPYVFPAFVLGSAGTMLVFTHTNVAIFQTAPASMAGTVGAIFNGALQCGSAVGLAAFESIETSVENTCDGDMACNGRVAAFWFLFGLVLAEVFSMSYFYRRDTERPRADDDDKPCVQNEVVA